MTPDSPSLTLETTAEASSYDRDPKRSEFFGFNRQNAVFSFDKKGQAISRKLVWPIEPWAVPSDGYQFNLPFLLVGSRGSTALPLGITIVSGPTAGGKSSFIRALAKRMKLVRLLTVEPHDSAAEVQSAPTFSSVDGALASAVQTLYQNRDTLPVIDSLRAPLFETTGAAGSKGLSMPFFTQITRVSNALARSGLTVMATVNPMDEDSEYVKAFFSKLSASVPATILLDRVNVEGSREPTRFTGTIQMRPNRRAMPFTYDVSEPPANYAPSSAFTFEVDDTQVEQTIINRAAVRAASII